MTLKEGRRVRLAADIRLADAVAEDAEPSAGGFVGFLSLGAGAEGTVERVVEEDRQPSQEVREYERLKSLLDSFGGDMPPESRRQLEEKVAALRPDWLAHQEQGLRRTVRVRFDNGFLLDGAPEDLFTDA